MISKKIAVLLIAATAALSACSAEQVVDNTVDTGLFAAKTVVRTGVGAGKMVGRGVGAVVN